MLYLTKSWVLVYDDSENSESNEGTSGTEGTEGSEKPKLKELIEKYSLQEELNSIMANNRKNLQQKNQQLIEQLTQLRDQASMSAQAKEELETRIEELQTQYMSKEELSKREVSKQAEKHLKEVEKLTSEAGKWQKMYSHSTIQRALLDAAIEGKALRPSQIVAILGQTTQIVEELDATGQGTGKYKPIVKFNDVDDNNDPITLELSPKEAIKRMKDLPEEYGNLFEGDSASGLGAGNIKGKEHAAKLSDILADPVKYQAWRKKNPDLDISKLRR